ncbi:MAG: leucyl aminopeptidase [Gammaproteobacteria bacterium]|jgi:leucyl aminopeptidase|nr:leucyl aminopeptidase [Gammaproteobacteria bacterium]MDH3864290.1 leucyl aminopeptidase [Gammaproteobacteria bacterium]MDH3905098.1 leucyl aminopeptidase [Gammaproteobacteria bacterium]MDH3953310.1 leucyl aminopeptidase [Gammaproteobacteria bacterium]MDH4005814.1 leucyl aminopeptidase [Gammaproteobacteria bacterium]
MDYFTTTSNAAKRATDCVIVGVYDRGKLSAGASEIDTASNGELRRLVKSGDVSSRSGRCVLLTNLNGVKAARVAVVGLGKPDDFDIHAFCRAVAAALSTVSESKCKDVLNTLTLEGAGDAGAYYLARQTVQTIGDVLYRFTEMKSKRKDSRMPLGKVGLSVASRGDAAKAMLGAKHGDAIVEGMSLAKDLGNLPPNVCTPTYLARTAQKLAKGNGKLTTRIVNETDMKRLGMHSLLSVTAGTNEPAKLIVMQYKNGGKSKPIVLVGKGVTFDSGGISLKPGPAMDEMKFDMCGAASVIGTMATVAALKLPVNLNVVVPAVENLPGSKATVPGDIFKSMSGQTIEILNTDAEGRLILCDALTYSRRFKPDTIIDVATLTGACVIALGKHHTGLMSHDDALADEIVEAGVNASDRAWRLPLSDEYAEQLKSNFADFANVGGRDGGAITAGCFLSKFTDGLKWAHLDIAGTAWKSGQKKGATGRPVPMLSEFVMSRCNALP